MFDFLALIIVALGFSSPIIICSIAILINESEKDRR